MQLAHNNTNTNNNNNSSLGNQRTLKNSTSIKMYTTTKDITPPFYRYFYTTTNKAFSLISTIIISLLISQLQLVDSGPTANALTAGPRVEISPRGSEQRVSTEDQFSLKCRARGEDPHAFSQHQWRSTKLDAEELKKRHNVSEIEPGTLVLSFYKPTYDDKDTYTCSALHQSSDALNASTSVSFYSPTKIIRCPERQFLVAKESGRSIYCEFTADSFFVYIYKNGQRLHSNNTRYKWNENAIEILGPADLTDAGNYSIQISSDESGVDRYVEIAVAIQSKPEILPHPDPTRGDQYYGVEGESATIECPVHGDPHPIITWLDPMKRNLTTVGGYIISPDRGTLQISKVDRNHDDGNFRCTAKNDAGEASREFRMNVITRPQIVAFANKTVDENQEVQFECRASGRPQPNFSIRRQGLNEVPLKPGDGILMDHTTEAEGGGSEVYVYRARARVNRSHFGLFYCNATNRAGSAESIAQLSVNYAPDLNGTSKQQYVKLGKQVTVTCHIRAHPMPRISWYYDNTQDINPVSSMKEGTDKQVYIVTYQPNSTRSINSGQYLCKAENIAGSSEVSITPRFSQPPTIVQPSLINATPTTVRLQLRVANDGGDRIRVFRYTLDGRTQDFNNPFLNRREDKHKEAVIDASLNNEAVYTFRNLLPNYEYKLKIRAENEIGSGDYSEFHLNTIKPTAPDPPIIKKPIGSISPQHSTRGIVSEYSNGYKLEWAPPELDNGDPINKYTVQFAELQENSLAISEESSETRAIEKVDDKAFYMYLGPLTEGRRYRIRLQAWNNFGPSRADELVVFVPSDKQSIEEFETQPLAWLTESPTTLATVLTGFVVLLILIDLVACFCYQIGLIYIIRNCCCPSKTNSVTTDKMGVDA